MVGDKKTITILSCALNEEKNIGLLLDDILNQSLDEEFNANFFIQDIVVVSDGSTDGTVEIVKKYCLIDSRIKLIENKKRISKIFSLEHFFKTSTALK